MKQTPHSTIPPGPAPQAGAGSQDVATAQTVLPALQPGLEPGRRPGHSASRGLVAIMIFLSVFALCGAAATYWTGAAVTRAVQQSSAFDAALDAAQTQGALARHYRLNPGPDVRGRQRAAASATLAALLAARNAASPAERPQIDDVIERHGFYGQAANRLFAAIDSGNASAGDAIERNEVDPAFERLLTPIGAAAERHRADALYFLATSDLVQTTLLAATVLLFVGGLILSIYLWIIQRTQQRQALDMLAREVFAAQVSERRMRGVMRNVADMVLICAARGNVTYQNPAAETAWGHPPGSLLEQSIQTLIHPDDQPALQELWEDLRPASENPAAAASRSIDVRLRDGAGAWRHAELAARSALDDPAVLGIVVTFRDIDARKAVEQRLMQQAFFDTLTRLPSQPLFLDRLNQALVRAGRKKERVGLLYLDLDDFAQVNERHGNKAGDDVLIEAAGRIKACVRVQDTVARLDQDKFVVVLELAGGERDGGQIADALLDQFSRPFRIDGRDIPVTVSIGIALGDAREDSADSLLRNARTAMYRAKARGKARHVAFEHTMHLKALDRIELTSDLRMANAAEEMRLHYQPIVLMKSGQLSGFEALIRWQHPIHGLVAPNDFIPIAEETGLIVPLGRWVLEQACRQIAAWQTQFHFQPPLTLSVNLSTRQFQQPGLVDDVARALQLSGLPAACLKLDITEAAIMLDVQATVATLWALKRLGVQLAIDDFGTGYSSVSFLKQLPLDLLKIDSSFVEGIGRDEEDTATVRAIMALARSLGMGVTGEGVETPEQAALLAAWGCELGQGYHYSRALDDAGMKALLRRTADARAAAPQQVAPGAPRPEPVA